MSQDIKSSVVRKIVKELTRRIIDILSEAIGQPIRHAIRKIAFIFAGILVALLGLTFVTIGVIKWLALFMPSWLSWILVGIIILLAGLVLALASR